MSPSNLYDLRLIYMPVVQFVVYLNALHVLNDYLSRRIARVAEVSEDAPIGQEELSHLIRREMVSEGMDIYLQTGEDQKLPRESARL